MVEKIPPQTASVKIKYDGQEKELKFNGNFGLKLGNKKFKVENGVFKTESGSPVKSLTLSKTMAYQLLGMSNTGYEGTDPTYTFDYEDFRTANEESQREISGMNALQHNTQIRIGWGATDYHLDRQVSFENGIFSTEYKSGPNSVSKVSIWQTK